MDINVIKFNWGKPFHCAPYQTFEFSERLDFFWFFLDPLEVEDEEVEVEEEEDDDDDVDVDVDDAEELMASTC